MSDIAKRDQNYVATIQGVSSLDGATPTDIWVNPTSHGIIIDATSIYSALDSRYVNVTGDAMSGDLSFTNSGINTTDYVDFDLEATSGTKVGRMRWNNTDRCLEYDSYIDGTTVTNQLGQEVWVRVRNNTGATIENGKGVYVTGALGNRPTIALADASEHTHSLAYLGITTEAIEDNKDGFVTVRGSVRSLNTNSFTVGDKIYVSADTAGEFVNVRPNAPDHSLVVGVVTVKNPSVGEIAVEANVLPIAEDIPANICDSTTYDNVQDYINQIGSAGWISGGAFTDNGDGSITVGSGTGLLRTTNSSNGNLVFCDWAEDSSVSLTNQSANYIAVNYNSGTPQITSSTTSTANGNTIFNLGLAFREGTDVHFFRAGQVVNDGIKRIIQRFNANGNIQLTSGGVVAETGARYLTVTNAILYGGITRFATDAIDTSGTDTFEYYYQDGAGDWQYISETATQINNTQYNNAGTLTNLTANRYRTDWLYLSNDGDLLVIIGTNNSTLADAQVVSPPTSQPAHISDFSTLIAKVIVQEGQTNLTEVDNLETNIFSSTGTIVHNETTDKQGGTTDEYYHLTAAQAAVVSNTSGTNTGDQTLPTRDSLGLDTDDSVTFANVYVPNGGFLGISGDAGWTFDSTNGDISTLSKVGIGTSTPTALFEVVKDDSTSIDRSPFSFESQGDYSEDTAMFLKRSRASLASLQDNDYGVWWKWVFMNDFPTYFIGANIGTQITDVSSTSEDVDMFFQTAVEGSVSTRLGIIGGNIEISGNLNLVDDKKILLGTGDDGEIYSSSDDIYIKNVTQDKDIYFNVNDGGVDTTNIFIDGSTGNVGMGTTTLSGKLHIEATAITGREKLLYTSVSDASRDFVAFANQTSTTSTFSPALSGAVESVSTKPSLWFQGLTNASNDTGTAPLITFLAELYPDDSGDPINASFSSVETRPLFSFQNVGTHVLDILANGNVGIGTTSPSAKVDINNTDTDLVGLAINSTSTTQPYLYMNGPAPEIRWRDSDASGTPLARMLGASGNMVFEADSSDEIAGSYMAFTVDGSEHIRLNSSGYVGIGTNSPVGKVEVVGKATSATYYSSFIVRPGETNADAAVAFESTRDSTTQRWFFGSGSGAGNNNFRLVDITNSVTDVFVVEPSSGNVGIGTTSPDTKLHIHDGSAGSVSAYPGSDITFESSDSTNLQFLSPNNKNNTIYFGDSDSNIAGGILYGHADDSLRFMNAGWQERITIDSSGRIGINANTPASTLEVNGGVNIGGTGAVSDNNLYVYNNCSAASFTDRTPFYDGDAITELKAIKGVDGKIDHTTLPVFAQKTGVKEVVEKIPVDGEDVVVEEDIERDLGAMISILVKAVQQLADRIEVLEADIIK